MGVPVELASGALRISLGRGTSAADIDAFLAAYTRVLVALTDRKAEAAA
jgi:cysteine sulfinate desulfinase/cysteine desulfurase-like protein